MKIAILLLPLLTSAGLAEEEHMTFYPLGNRKDLNTWKGEGYTLKDGVITCTPEGKNLSTKRRFANYVLDFEFKLPPGGNNGLGIHFPGTGNPAYSGMELQVLDDGAEKHKDLKDYQFHGSLYTLQPAKKGALKPAGEWNLQRVIVNGPLVKVDLNGQIILDANLDELQAKHPEHVGVKRRGGHITLCGHGDPVSFRKFRICEIPPAANKEGVKAAGFRELFDGKTLEGWKVEEGSEKHWLPINGILKYDGRSTAKIKDLWTKDSFGDFTLVFDWRWAGSGPKMMRPIIGVDGNQTGKEVEVEELDSGIYVRGNSKSQVNLWNWPAGSGEVYGYRVDKKLPAEVRAAVTPRMKADKPLGEWNRTMITMKGDRLTVVLNGQTVINKAQLPGVPDEGPIGLQHHGSMIDFANIWIKEL